MNLIAKCFFVFLVAFLILIAALWIVPAPAAPTGQLHPEYSSMLKSGSSVAADSTVKWLAYLFGVGVIGIFGFCIVIGSRKKDQKIQQNLRRVIAFGIALYLIVYTLMLISYWQYYETGSQAFIAGFPIPTSWMIYGMWTAPAAITIFFVLKFDDWILKPEEIEAFHQIVAERRKREQGLSPDS